MSRNLSAAEIEAELERLDDVEEEAFRAAAARARTSGKGVDRGDATHTGPRPSALKPGGMHHSDADCSGATTAPATAADDDAQPEPEQSEPVDLSAEDAAALQRLSDEVDRGGADAAQKSLLEEGARALKSPADGVGTDGSDIM